MYMEIIPTWKVEWNRTAGPSNFERHGLSFRVSDDNIEGFLRTLMFNGVRDITMQKEVPGEDLPFNPPQIITRDDPSHGGSI